MGGPIALVGAGEFLNEMAAFDAGLLRATGRRRPRVALLPTASFPDGEKTFQRWIAMGQHHFRALGAEVEAVLVRDRAGAEDPGHAQAVAEADLVYLSGGRPRYLLDVLRGSTVWDAALRANERGAILVGCSAGAMVLADRQVDARRRVVPCWRPALGTVPGICVLPHYNAWPEPLVAIVSLAAPRGIAVLGIDEDTATVGRDGVWQVHGRGRVTLWRGRHRERHRNGDTFRLAGAGAGLRGPGGAPASPVGDAAPRQDGAASGERDAGSSEPPPGP